MVDDERVSRTAREYEAVWVSALHRAINKAVLQ